MKIEQHYRAHIEGQYIDESERPAQNVCRTLEENNAFVNVKIYHRKRYFPEMLIKCS